VQRSNTDQLVFNPVDLIVYLSEIVTLRPGDVISTGTPGGVGHVRTPPRYLTDGTVMTTRIDGIGECINTCRKQQRPTS
jgi:acylpyruvate hydrolase